MNYPNGEQARLGDKVRLGDAEGVVVACIDTDEYTFAHSKAQWSYLGRGALIEFPRYGLIHYEQAEPDLQLVARASADIARST